LKERYSIGRNDRRNGVNDMDCMKHDTLLVFGILARLFWEDVMSGMGFVYREGLR